jgi:alkylhydroperoxidase family enzyme
MPLIETVVPEVAQGQIADVYRGFEEKIGLVPKPLEMTSASPRLFDLAARRLSYFASHPSLGFPLLAYIRYLVAFRNQFPYCVDLNGGILKQALGMSDEQMAALRTDPASCLLAEKDKTMLLFVLKAVETPEDVSAQDIAALHRHGWSDSDIFDALNHGASMVSTGIMFTALKMGEV